MGVAEKRWDRRTGRKREGENCDWEVNNNNKSIKKNCTAIPRLIFLFFPHLLTLVTKEKCVCVCVNKEREMFLCFT